MGGGQKLDEGTQDEEAQHVAYTFLPRMLLLGKSIAMVYWLWFLKVSILPSTSEFDSIIAGTGPLVASLHFIQLLVVVRRLDPRASFWREAIQILLFGAFHIVGRLLQTRLSSRRVS